MKLTNINSNNDLWNFNVNILQKSIKSGYSPLENRIVEKLQFTIENRKHVWLSTIKKMPNPLEPDKTVGESMSISKHKNHVTLYPHGQLRIIKNGIVRELKAEDCGNK